MNPTIVDWKTRAQLLTTTVMHSQTRQVETYRAELARQFAVHYSLIAAMPDGEDSAGRARLRVMTPLEAVERACTLANLLAAEFEARSWLQDIPEIPRPITPPTDHTIEPDET